MGTTAKTKAVCMVAFCTMLSSACYVFARSPKAAREATPATGVEDQLETPALAYIVVTLARDPAVQSELQLSAKQSGAVNDAVVEVDQPLWVLRDVPAAKGWQRVDQLLAQFQRRLQDSLTPAQLDRLNQMVLQARGYKALIAPEISKQLELSSEQISRLKAVLAQAKSQQPDSQKIQEILSSEQQATLSTLVGKPFDFDRIVRVGASAPELKAVSTWINSPPLKLENLRGKVVVVHFWAFGCINCVHNLPHYQSWYQKFPKAKLEIIGIHTPETEHERSVDNVRGSVAERAIEYPVAVDLDAENWKAWGNSVWPSVYLIDKKGRVRYWWYGELNWKEAKGEEFIRKKIEQLLAEK